MFNEQLAQAGERSIPLTLLDPPARLRRDRRRGRAAAARALGRARHDRPGRAPEPPRPDGLRTSAPCSCSSGSRSASTTRSSTSSASARSGPRARAHRAALEAAAATSGRSVLISGVTVMIAMAGMLFSGDKTYLSFGIATMMVVAVAMLGSLTVLPALLSKLGDRVEKGRIPFLGRLRRRAGENRFWSAILTPALRHPARLGARRDGRAARDGAAACCTSTPRSPASTRCRRACATVGTIDKIQEHVPGRRRPGARRDQGGRRLAGDAARRSPTLRTQALASGQMHGPIDGRRQREPHR